MCVPVQFYGMQAFRPMAAGDETAFVYKFIPHEAIEPQEFGFLLNVIFRDADEELFAKSVYNGTVSVADSLAPFDWLQLLRPLVVLAAFGYAANKFFNGGKSLLAGSGKAKKDAAPAAAAPAAAVETGTKAKAIAKDDDWLANLNVAKPKCAKSIL
jgi:hypothetical protein